MTARRIQGVGRPTIGGRDCHTDCTALIVFDTCQSAITAISGLETLAREVARRFRFAPGVDAQRGLTHLVESTQTLVRVASMTAAVAGADLAPLCARCGQAGVRLETAVASAICAELVTDWEDLASTLETELAGALSAWRRVFAALVEPFDSGPTGHAA